MAVCSSCGENNPKKKQFCTKCGVILQSGNEGIDIAKDFDSQSFAKYSEDFISKSFAEKKPPPSEKKTAPNDQQFSHQASAPPPAQEISRANVLKLVAKAGAKAIIKSVSLSILVLGPGFAMLMMGITIPGMIWLFCGSFGLMAWTYRKPWRLGVISCLIPPVAAGAVYVIQLYLFGSASPPVLLLAGAIAVGLGVGFWRAQTHNVTHADDGGIIAERTIGYLLVWVAAYALTQTMGLLAFNVYAVRAGLLTGAFTTAMLTIVSFVIWSRYRRLVANTIIVVLLSIAGLAEFNVPASAQTSFCDATFRSPYQLWSACKGLSNKGVTYPPLLEILSYKNSNTSDVDSLLIQADRTAEIAGAANASKAVELYIEAARRENPRNLISRRYILGQARKIMFRNNYPAGRLRAIEIEQLKLQSVICAAQKQGFTGLPRFSLEQKNAASCLAQAERALKLAGQTQPQPGKAQPRTRTTTTAGTGTPGPDTPLCWSGISDGYVGPVPGMSENNPSCEFVMSCNEAKTVDERGGEVKYVVRGKGYETTGFIEIGGCYQILQPQETVQNPPTEVVPGNGDNLDRPVNISPEAAATAAAAVATVLIAAGVAVSIAQAIAAAIANALQAGVQLTSEEIQRAVTEALFGLKSESASGETGSGTDPPDAKGNAPPNVSFTERVRPPTPVLQPDGTPFESNDKGQYRVPVGNGEWGWRSRSEAREASATMRREQARHDGENSASAPGETGSGTEPPEPESNAPPNVTSRERVRPPTPVYQPDGTPFESNDKGQYWAPDENGDERWMSKREAEDAAAALQAEEDRRKSERDAHDRETEDMLARSRQQAEARHSEERDAEARAKAEQTARAGGGDSPDEGGDGDKGGRIYRDPRYAEPGWDNTGFGWATNFFGDFFGGVGKDSSDLITDTPGALKGAARAAGSALVNVDNWKSAVATGSEIGMYLTALQRGDIDRLGKAGSTIANVARQAGEAVYNDPGGSAVAVVETVLGADNWRKATDPNVPVTERFGRAVWGTIDTGGLVVGGVGLAAKGVGKAGSLLRGGDALADAAKVARAADKVGDAAGAARTADKIGDTAAAARTADKVSDTASAARTADKVGDTASAARTADKVGDTASAARTADKVGDTASAARTADKVGDTAAAARTADKVGDTASAARTADKTADDSGAAARIASQGDEAATSGKVASSGDDAAGLSSMDDGPGGGSGGGDAPTGPGLDDAPPKNPNLGDELPPPGAADETADVAGVADDALDSVNDGVWRPINPEAIPNSWNTQIPTRMGLQMGNKDCAEQVGRTLMSESAILNVDDPKLAETFLKHRVGPGKGISPSKFGDFMKDLGFDTGSVLVNDLSDANEQANQLRRFFDKRPDSKLVVDMGMPESIGRHAGVIDGIDAQNRLIIREPSLGYKIKVPIEDVISGNARAPSGKLSINWRTSVTVSDPLP